MSEPFGTTPFPVALDPISAFATLHVNYDPSLAIGSDISQLQQPIQQEIASFNAENADYSLHGAAVVAVNQHFVIYAVKKGLIRVLHRHSSMKSLFRLHQNETVSDIQVFQNGEVLASVSATANVSNLSSKVVVWRVSERATSDIVTSPLLEIQSRSIRMIRVVWHPSDMNQFWLLHSRANSQKLLIMATLVNTTRIATKPDPTSGHPTSEFATWATWQQGSTVLFLDSFDSSLHDLSWCGSDSQYTVAAYDNGDIILYDLNSTTPYVSPDDSVSNITRPAILQKVNQGSSMARCILLPHYDALSSNSMSGSDPKVKVQRQPYSSCFVTGAKGNAEFTLWSAFSPEASPVKIQVVQIASPSRSYVWNVCFGHAPKTGAPPSCFVTACCREVGAIYAFHLKAAWSLDQKPLLVGSDYVVPFSTKYPVLSSTVTCVPAADISEEVLLEQGGIIFDMKLYVYQTVSVQCLTLTSYMCLPPANTYTDATAGVSVNRNMNRELPEKGELLDDYVEFEEYDVEEDDSAPDPSSLPMPNDVSSQVTPSVLVDSNSPFTNWLGAIAGKPLDSSVQATVTTPNTNMPPVTEMSALPAPAQKSNLLSPMEILGMIPVGSASSIMPTLNPKESATQQATIQSHRTDVNKGAVIMQSLPEQDNSGLTSEIRAVVREEIHALMDSVIRSEIANCIEPISSVIPSIQDSIDHLVQQLSNESLLNSNRSDRYASDLALGLQEPFRAAFAECIRSILLPAIDSISNQVYSSVCKRMDEALPAIGNNNEKLDSLSLQLTTMTSLVTKLSDEVNALRTTVENSSTIPVTMNAPSTQVAPTKTAVDPFDGQRAEILQFLKGENYELAFRRAVANETADMTIFCCHKASLQEVFASGQSKLSQPILLCIMQQLGTTLVTASELQIVLDWLQEISLSLYPPVDPQIRHHLPIVVKQVSASLSKRMEREGNELPLERSLRKLQSLLRGMLV